MIRGLVFGGLLAANLPSFAIAGDSDLIDARAERLDDGRLRVAATIRHADEGWDHYADRFEVLAADGTVLAVRELAHPHVDEQPFTRSTGAFDVPAGAAMLTVRARDSRHGFGGAEFELELAPNEAELLRK